jgi:hypothetical protein
MSAEEYLPPSNKLPYFAGMSESVVVEISGHLGISESAQKLIRTYFAYQELGSMQLIAHECGMTTAEAEGTLYMIESTIEKSAQSAQAEESVQERLASYILGSTNKDFIFSEQEVRESNPLPQEGNMKGGSKAACIDASVDEMDNYFISDKAQKQKKMIAKYCLNCPLMDACALEAIEMNEKQSARGGFTTGALRIIHSGKNSG